MHGLGFQGECREVGFGCSLGLVLVLFGCVGLGFFLTKSQQQKYTAKPNQPTNLNNLDEKALKLKCF